MPDIEDHVLESLEEHHVIKWVASEVDGMKPDEGPFRAKVTVLIESMRHHVEEEETELFPQVRQALGRKALGELGSTMEQAKKFAPTRPHPRAPDTPRGHGTRGAVGLHPNRCEEVKDYPRLEAFSRGRLQHGGPHAGSAGTPGRPVARQAGGVVLRQGEP